MFCHLPFFKFSVDGSDKSDRFWRREPESAAARRAEEPVQRFTFDDRVEVLEKPMSAFEVLPASEERGL
ncbi:hypothetical protein ILYODFUR_011000 [Ilyodon furcidens]|uniref:Uncharacterized protein n=1 Tax=Ilyodon furcidens TaxID=33524 RepID=A0ABV0V4X9_9TELE